MGLGTMWLEKCMGLGTLWLEKNLSLCLSVEGQNPVFFFKNDYIFIKFGSFVENSMLFKKYTQKVLSYLTIFTSTDSKKNLQV